MVVKVVVHMDGQSATIVKLESIHNVPIEDLTRTILEDVAMVWDMEDFDVFVEKHCLYLGAKLAEQEDDPVRLTSVESLKNGVKLAVGVLPEDELVTPVGERDASVASSTASSAADLREALQNNTSEQLVSGDGRFGKAGKGPRREPPKENAMPAVANTSNVGNTKTVQEQQSTQTTSEETRAKRKRTDMERDSRGMEQRAETANVPVPAQQQESHEDEDDEEDVPTDFGAPVQSSPKSADEGQQITNICDQQNLAMKRNNETNQPIEELAAKRKKIADESVFVANGDTNPPMLNPQRGTYLVCERVEGECVLFFANDFCGVCGSSGHHQSGHCELERWLSRGFRLAHEHIDGASQPSCVLDTRRRLACTRCNGEDHPPHQCPVSLNNTEHMNSNNYFAYTRKIVDGVDIFVAEKVPAEKIGEFDTRCPHCGNNDHSDIRSCPFIAPKGTYARKLQLDANTNIVVLEQDICDVCHNTGHLANKCPFKPKPGESYLKRNYKPPVKQLLVYDHSTEFCPICGHNCGHYEGAPCPFLIPAGTNVQRRETSDGQQFFVLRNPNDGSPMASTFGRLPSDVTFEPSIISQTSASPSCLDCRTPFATQAALECHMASGLCPANLEHVAHKRYETEPGSTTQKNIAPFERAYDGEKNVEVLAAGGFKGGRSGTSIGKKCDGCGKVFESLHDLNFHQKTCLEYKRAYKYRCYGCHQTFPNYEFLAEHKKSCAKSLSKMSSGSNASSRCELCNFLSTSEEMAKNHAETCKLHNGKCQSCFQCGRAFATLPDLHRHKAENNCSRTGKFELKETPKGGNINCPMCCFITKSPEVLDFHIQTCEQVATKHICFDCGEVFPTPIARHRHNIFGCVAIDDKEKLAQPFTCPACGQKMTWADWREHRMNCPIYSRLEWCQGCKRSFNTKDELKTHQAYCQGMMELKEKSSSRGGGSRQFSCRNCNKKFENRMLLTAHEESCTAAGGRKKEKCFGCGQLFDDKLELMDHKKVCKWSKTRRL